MPEGPEVQLVVDHLHLFLEGRALKNVEIIGGKYKNNLPPNFEEFKRELPLYFSKVTAKGKMIIFHLKTLGGQPSKFNIYAGLGMTGNFTFAPNEREMKHAAFQFNIEGKAPFPTSFIYTDSRRFGNVYFSTQNLSDKLAPGALQDSSWENFIERVSKMNTKRDILSILLDQEKIISGIGNYLAAEILYAAKISPFRASNQISVEEWKRIFDAAKTISLLSYQVSGCQIKDFTSPVQDGQNFKNYLQVYGRAETPKGEKVSSDIGSHQRTIWWVPTVQK